MTEPAHAVVTAEYVHPDEGRRALSFGVRADTLCRQLAEVAPWVPTEATWSARAGSDVTGHAK